MAAGDVQIYPLSKYGSLGPTVETILGAVQNGGANDILFGLWNDEEFAITFVEGV